MTLTITRLTTSGDGMAGEEGPFPRTLPNEVVERGPDGSARIITPAPTRVKAPCRHFKSCGGCAMQHADDSFVADWKTNIISTGLKARGIETEIRPILTSPGQSRRRASLHGKRTKLGAMIGFHTKGSDLLIETPDCKLLDPELMAAFPVFAELTVLAASRKAELELLATLSENGIDLDMRGCKPLDPQTSLRAAALADQHGFARIAWDGEVIAQKMPPSQRFGTTAVSPPPGAFLQATLHGQKVLTDAVVTAIGSAKHVVDLFAGCGTFTMPVAQNAEVWALEGDADLIASLDQGWRAARGLKKVKAETRDLFRRPVLAQEFKRTDAIIIDPPRAGAEAQSIEIAQSDVPVIAAVSCNPVTFARDAKIFIKGGYCLEWVQPVDQFRWSAHVELAALFRRPHIA